MAIVDNEPVPTFFGKSFMSVDESEATSADFQAPKKENRWCLLELPKEDIEALEAGKVFHIKAHGTGSSSQAAFCTETKTFGLEFLENSNPMYLGSVAEMAALPKNAADGENKDPNSTGEEAATQKPKVPTKECEIFAQCRGHLLLKPLSSDSQRVRDLLSPHSLNGPKQGVGEPQTTSSLQFQVAASPNELKSILEQGPYVESNGAWQWMPAAFEREVTDVCLNLISLKNWSLASVDVKALLKAVQENFGEDGARHVPSTDVLLNALRDVTRDAAAAAPAEKPSGEAPDKATAEKPAEPAAPALEEGKIALDAEKVRLFHATQLLRESSTRLRERFDLPAPAARPKRPRLGGAAAARGGREAILQIEEFAAAFSAQSGQETSIEDLCKIVGDRMYIDEVDGAVHPLDVATLPQEPRERLKRLFELSSHWKPDRLASLMAPVVKSAKVDVWLIKNTKTVFWEIENGKEARMFTRKFVIS